MLANISNYEDRIGAGKKVERLIIDQLKQKGMNIVDSTPHEDQNEKIDGWYITKESGKKYSFQIKFRESGDDVLFEIVKDLKENIPGRDFISKANLYIVSNRNGLTRMFLTKPFKDIATEILNIVRNDMAKHHVKRDWSGSGWEAKLQFDRAHGNLKLVAYFNPNMFDVLGNWQLNIH